MQAMTPVTHRRDSRHKLVADDQRVRPEVTGRGNPLQAPNQLAEGDPTLAFYLLPFALLSGLPGDVELADGVAACRAAGVGDAR